MDPALHMSRNPQEPEEWIQLLDDGVLDRAPNSSTFGILLAQTHACTNITNTQSIARSTYLRVRTMLARLYATPHAPMRTRTLTHSACRHVCTHGRALARTRWFTPRSRTTERCYYYNPKTGDTVWTLAAGPNVVISPSYEIFNSRHAAAASCAPAHAVESEPQDAGMAKALAASPARTDQAPPVFQPVLSSRIL